MKYLIAPVSSSTPVTLAAGLALRSFIRSTPPVATTSGSAERVDGRWPAPKGASKFGELAVSLKRYPDTTRGSPTAGYPDTKRGSPTAGSPAAGLAGAGLAVPAGPANANDAGFSLGGGGLFAFFPLPPRAP